MYLHYTFIVHAVENDSNLHRHLLYSYGKSGMPMDALTIFWKITEPELTLWNFVIRLCAKHGENAVSFQLFIRMQVQGNLPDQYSYASILSACHFEEDLWNGKCIHAAILENTVAEDVVVLTALVNMYGECFSLDYANEAFLSMQSQDTVAWNAIITMNIHHGDCEFATLLYKTMQNKGFVPDSVTVTGILSAYANLATLNKGIQLHAQIIASSSKVNAIMITSLLNMYGKCGNISAAKRLFDGICKVDSVVWNAMISAYAQNGQGNDAIELFNQMRNEGVKPTKTTFLVVLEACTNEKAFVCGREMHLLIKQSGYETDLMVGTALLTMYGKCGFLEEAFHVFDKLTNRTVVPWNALIACYSQCTCSADAIQFFDQMLSEGLIPDKITFMNIFPVCSALATIAECMRMHSIAERIPERDDNVRAGLMSMYGKLGRIDDVKSLFYSCSCSASVSVWTALVAAWSEIGSDDNALECFNQMLVEGVLPDKVATVSIITAFANQCSLRRGLYAHACILGAQLELEIDVQNALFSMYAKCGNIDAALSMFKKISIRDAISFRVMIAIFVQLDNMDEAVHVFWQMLYEGMAPDDVTLATILTLCGSHGALSQGLKLHTCSIYMDNLDGFVIETALLSMYSCCGCLRKAWKIFETSGPKDDSIWTSMIEACAFHGEGEACVSLFGYMQQEKSIPDKSTLIKLLLACSHAGLIDEAVHAFCNFSSYHSCEMIVDHFNCMVDVFGRVGQLQEAVEMVKIMPFLPNTFSWSILLSSCRMFFDVKRGESAAASIFELEPENVATYVSLSNIYVTAGASDVGWS
ncbi:hypothetical protein KP509_20G057100 [Ceratopteris richardii]|nr:hypothetical protein KP509_20G057100 [Ceratopteris richardii]